MGNNRHRRILMRSSALAGALSLALAGGAFAAEERTVALRPLGADARQDVLPLDQVAERLAREALPPDLRA